MTGPSSASAVIFYRPNAGASISIGYVIRRSRQFIWGGLNKSAGRSPMALRSRGEVGNKDRSRDKPLLHSRGRRIAEMIPGYHICGSRPSSSSSCSSQLAGYQDSVRSSGIRSASAGTIILGSCIGSRLLGFLLIYLKIVS